MSACTFFGHRDCPGEVREQLRRVIVELIENQGIDTFYMGRQGVFDAMARSILRELAEKYPHIRYAVVLERPPAGGPAQDFSDTMLPEGAEAVRPRYAIAWRNGWMLRRSDYVVAYVTRPWGGAARFVEQARRQGKTVINLGE